METGKRRLISGIFLVAVVLMIFSEGSRKAAFGETPLLNIPRMIQECPYFSDHPGSNGIIWLKDVHYSLGADGSMTRLSTRVILARRGISDRWTRWSFPILDGGTVEVLSAALYDPGSGRVITPVLPRKAEAGGVPFMEVLFPDLQDEFIIVLSLREVLPKRFAVEDFLWVNEELPQWEQKITVDVPGGMELVIASSDVAEAKKEKGIRDRYFWHIVNSPAWTGRTLKNDARSYLSFSTRKGTEPLARLLDGLDSIFIPQPPIAVQAMLDQGTGLKAGYFLIDWMKKAPEFSMGFPSSFVRSSIPSEGPWTQWEKVLLLNRWIRKAGWESHLQWLAAYPLNSESPAAEASVIRPVMELNFPGISSFYCDLGEGSSPGENPPSLWGKRIYTPSGSGLEGRVISGSTAAEHRLSMEWTLSLDADGVTSGKVDVFVRNGWVAFFFPGGSPSGDLVKRMTAELFPGMKFTEGNETVVPIKYGWKITLPAELKQTIVNGRAMLVPFPAAAPSWLAELGKTSGEYRMRFPFVVEQNFTLKLPSKSEVVMMPSAVNRTLDKIHYEETIYHNKRRNTIAAGVKLVLSSDTITDNVGKSLSESVRRWMDYASKTLPLRIKQ